MEELLQRLASLDPAAEGAVRAIAYFDKLVEGRAGLEAFVRAAAILAGCPAGLHDPDRHVLVRMHPDGHRLEAGAFLDEWPMVELAGGDGGRVWLERQADPSPTDAIILERLAVGVRVGLDRTRGRGPARDPASVEALLSPDTSASARRQAARRIALPTDLMVKVVAILAEPDSVAPKSADLSRWSAQLGRVLAAIVPADLEPETSARIGLGPAVEPVDLPRSWQGALQALRLTGTDGPPRLRYDDLGGLGIIAERISPAEALVDDVLAIRAAQDQIPGALPTLTALSEHDSLRAAATALYLHHSTLQARIPRLATVLGYRPDTAPGRNRLHIALALNRINRNGILP
ncbi:MAG: hypothetical protein JWN03_4379 [Nocardia sp.]|uniref:helix-turn-helix domain-containing protein n=1 Tax=Nocardia sp. TaxID=1821 RepID=UPI002627AEDA|nr:helix-turn-helix domain-containing protein [Nocardia sp.]MCU1644104.1 hypothetical protein [Nocardia sp.]